MDASSLDRIATALEHIADSLATHDRWLSMTAEGALRASEQQADITAALCRIEASLLE